MEVNQKFWNRTKIGSVLDIFPGQIGEYLQKTTGRELLQCQKFLPYIFWRWQFLRLAGSIQEWTPAEALSYFTKKEHWPEGGQFNCQPNLKIKDGKAEITIDAQYIDFKQQALFCGKNDDSLGKNFSWDLKYFSEKDNLSDDELIKLTKSYFSGQLSLWRVDDPFIRESYTAEEWESFWLNLLKKSVKTEGVGTDEVMDAHVLRVRKIYPDYGLTNNEIRIKKKYSQESEVVFYHFWLSANQYVFLPLSLYLNLVGLGFLDTESFDYDVKNLMQNYYEDPIPMITPATYFYLTPFGKKVFL